MSTRSHIPLRVAVVQFAPKIGQVDANIAKAKLLCAKLEPHSVDLVCLPEMIFTGYMFPNAHSIYPYLEDPHIGSTSRFCSDLALSLRCYVTAGFPERLSPGEIGVEDATGTHAAGNNDVEGEVGKKNKISMVGANSAVLYGPDGCWVGGHRKTNLFRTDLTWAKAGTGFTTFQLPAPLQTVTLAICNDLNVSSSTSHLPPPQHTDPQDASPSQSPTQTRSSWTLKDGPYELADYCITQKTNLLILLDAWLDSGKSIHDDDDEGGEYDWHNINYWAARLRPLWVNEGVEGGFAEDGDITETDVGEETVVVVCNRFGEENGESFAGTSSLLSLRRKSGRPKLLEVMGRREEGVRLWAVG